MIYISHRGNINEIYPEKENSPEYIDNAISKGYYVEMDVRYIDTKLLLGHDNPQYEVSLKWLTDRGKSLFVHTKDFASLNFLISHGLKIFYHQNENHTIINNSGLIWSHKLSETSRKSIIPLLSYNELLTYQKYNVYGICSDFIGYLKEC